MEQGLRPLSVCACAPFGYDMSVLFGSRTPPAMKALSGLAAFLFVRRVTNQRDHRNKYVYIPRSIYLKQYVFSGHETAE